ncbi:MAG: hypothetical protein AAGH15_07295 [Myxococcota bacterium]
MASGNPYGAQPGRCPAGFVCREDPTHPLGFGTCGSPTGSADPIVFEAPDTDDDVGVPVVLRWTVNGRPWPDQVPLARGFQAPSLSLHGTQPPHSTRYIDLREGQTTVRLAPGSYDVRYFLDSADATDGRLPSARREGRLRVAASGEAVLDWDLSVVDWTVLVEGTVPPEFVEIYFESPGLLWPIGAAGAGSGTVLLPNGDYRVHARLGGEGFGGSAELGMLRVGGDRAADFSVQAIAVEGTVRVDGDALRRDYAHAVFRDRRHQWEFPVDPATGRFEAQLVDGSYRTGFRVSGDLGHLSGAPVRATSTMDIQARRTRIRGQLTFGGEGIPDRWDDPRVVLYNPSPPPGDARANASVASAPLDASGFFEADVMAPQPYLVTFMADRRIQRFAYREGYDIRASSSVVIPAPGEGASPVDFAMTRLTVSLTENGAPIPEDDPTLARGVLGLWPVELDAVTPPQRLEFPGSGEMRASGRVLSGRYTLYFVRMPREGLAGSPGAVALETLDLRPGEGVTRSFDLRAGVLEGRLRTSSGSSEDPPDPGSRFLRGRGPLFLTVRSDYARFSMVDEVAADGSFSVPLLEGTYDVGLYRCTDDDPASCSPRIAVGGSGMTLVERLEIPRTP